MKMNSGGPEPRSCKVNIHHYPPTPSSSIIIYFLDRILPAVVYRGPEGSNTNEKENTN